MRASLLPGGIITLCILGAVSCINQDEIEDTLDEYSDFVHDVWDILEDLQDTTDTVSAMLPSVVAQIASMNSHILDLPTEPVTVVNGGTSDIDADGCDEALSVFISDREVATYLGWSGDGCSGDEGICWLSWRDEFDVVWMVSSACVNPQGSVICWTEEDDVACMACNILGECNSCDEDSNFCAWPYVPVERSEGAMEGERRSVNMQALPEPGVVLSPAPPVRSAQRAVAK